MSGKKPPGIVMSLMKNPVGDLENSVYSRFAARQGITPEEVLKRRDHIPVGIPLQSFALASLRLVRQPPGTANQFESLSKSHSPMW